MATCSLRLAESVPAEQMVPSAGCAGAASRGWVTRVVSPLRGSSDDSLPVRWLTPPANVVSARRASIIIEQTLPFSEGADSSSRSSRWGLRFAFRLRVRLTPVAGWIPAVDVAGQNSRGGIGRSIVERGSATLPECFHRTEVLGAAVSCVLNLRYNFVPCFFRLVV